MPDREGKAFDPANHTAISFRRCGPGDISTCARLAEDAWPADPAIASKGLESLRMKGYIEYSLSLANWTDIAYTSEGVAGFLFGRIGNYPGAPMPRKSQFGELPTILRSFFEKDRMSPGSLGFLWRFALTELKLKIVAPKSDASIEMFIVHTRHRGKGIGSELMDRFLRAARGAGSLLVTVYTDDRTSNWQFYEKRGFKRVGTFHDNVTSHYSGMYARGIVFALDLRGEGRQREVTGRG